MAAILQITFKKMYFDSNSLKYVPKGPVVKKASIDSENGLPPKRRQAII